MIWRWIKDRLANKAFETLQKVSDAVADIINTLTTGIVKSITGWNMYKDAMQILTA